MAQIVFPDQGLTRLQDYLTGQGSGATDLTLTDFFLFTNNLSPDRSTLWVNLTEATFGGYARKAFAVAAFGPAAIAGHVASSVGTLLTWTYTGAPSETIYGWGLVDSGASKLIAVATFDSGPYTLSVVGQTIQFTPTLQLLSRYSTTP